MVALRAGKRLVVNPLLKLKSLSLVMDLRLLMLSITVRRVNRKIPQTHGYKRIVTQTGLSFRRGGMAEQLKAYKMESVV